MIVQVQIYLWQFSYSTQCIYVASDLEMLFSCLTFVEWETNRGKKLRVKEGGAPEHTHWLRNRHWPMVAQRCLGAKTNSPRMFTLVSCIELPKQTSFRPDFVRNYVLSVRSSISFEVYQGLYSHMKKKGHPSEFHGFPYQDKIKKIIWSLAGLKIWKIKPQMKTTHDIVCHY